MLLDGQPLRVFGSRGQVRTLVLALKLAELLAAHARGDRPVLLLDDLSSELDRQRTARLVEVLAGLDAQAFLGGQVQQQRGTHGRRCVHQGRAGDADRGGDPLSQLGGNAC